MFIDKGFVFFMNCMLGLRIERKRIYLGIEDNAGKFWNVFFILL